MQTEEQRLKYRLKSVHVAIVILGIALIASSVQGLVNVIKLKHRLEHCLEKKK